MYNSNRETLGREHPWQGTVAEIARMRTGYIYIYIYTSVLLCIYMHKSRWTREVRGRLIRGIDVEYKRIEILSENLSQILSQSTQPRTVERVEQKGSEL